MSRVHSPDVRARDLASRLALRLSDGSLTKLPRFVDGENPLRVRASLQAYYVLHDSLLKQLQLWPQGDRSLSDLLALTRTRYEIEFSIAASRAWLSRVARAGGRGFDVLTEASP